MRTRTAAAMTMLLLLTAAPATLLPSASATNFAVLLDPGGNLTGSGAPAVAFDAQGGGIAAWTTGQSSPYYVTVARHVYGQGWAPARDLSSGRALGAVVTDVAAADGGYLAVAWHEDGPTSAAAAVFDPTRGWTPPVRLNLSGAESTSPRVAAIGPGAFAFFFRDNTNSVWEPALRVWSASGGWLPAQSLSSSGHVGMDGDVAGDGKGNAAVLWFEANGSAVDIFVVGPTAPPMPNIPMPLMTISGSAYGPRVEIGPSGRAVAGWYWIATSGPVPPYPDSGLFVTVLDAGASTWSGPEMVSSTTQPLASSWFAMLPEVDDEVLVAFYQNASGLDVRARSSGGGWGPTTTLGSFAPSSAPSLVGGGGGEPVVAVWAGRSAAGTQMATATYLPASGWTPPEVAAVDDDGVQSVVAAADGRGGAWAVFPGSDQRMRGFYIVDRTPPTFAVVEPSEGAVFDRASCWVRVSQVPLGATVEANGVRAANDGGGAFSALVPLEPGANRVLIVVTDGNGNRASAAVNVTFEDPVPALEQQLNVTAAELENATAAAFDYFLKIDTIEGEANDTKAKLNETEQQLANVTHEVGHWLGLYNASLDIIANLSADLNETQEKVNGSVPTETLSLNFEEIKGQLNDTRLALNASQSAQQQQESDLQFLRQRAEDASSAASLATVAALAGAALGAAGIAASLRGRGGGGGKKVTVRGWDPEKKEAIQGKADPGAADNAREPRGYSQSTGQRGREAGSSQATGKREHSPAAPDGGDPAGKEYSPAEEQLKGNPRH